MPDPTGGAGRWRGAALSVALHGLILFLLLTPLVASDSVQAVLTSGAGGPGPAGGGGGGRGGTGGLLRDPVVTERLHYVEVVPRPVAPPPPPPKPVPKPEAPPVPPPPPKVEPKAQPDPPADVGATPPDVSSVPGTGGGTGNDGTAGNGPGTGGGTGSGVGTGQGSGVGPGTGGGEGTIYPPAPTQVFMPPQPAPAKIRPYEIVAVFEVDERGNVRSFDFNRSRDGGYNKKVEQMLREIRFRPAVRPDGTPIAAKVSLNWTVY
jgi:protein TonB